MTPDTMFDKHGLLTAHVASLVQNGLPMATAPANPTPKGTYTYHDGMWHHDAEQAIAYKLARLLKDRYRPAHTHTVADYIAATSPELTDSDPNELNTPTGIVDLTTAKCREHEPQAHHTQMTSQSPMLTSDGLTTPGLPEDSPWLVFLRRAFNDDSDMIGYVQVHLGAALFGDSRSQKVPFLHGRPATSKTQLQNAIYAVLGTYAIWAPVTLILDKSSDSHRTEIARLAGARLVLMEEPSPNQKVDEGKFNSLAGGGTLTANFMRQNHFDFHPTHTLFLTGNHRPTVSVGSEDGFWRRCELIPFDHPVPADQQVPDIGNQLAQTHSDHILSWLIEGARYYHQNGLPPQPAQVRTSNEDYMRDMSSIQRFVETHCACSNPDAYTRLDYFTQQYKWFCEQSNETPKRGQALQDALRKYGVTAGKRDRGRTRVFNGITIHNPIDPDEIATLRDRGRTF